MYILKTIKFIASGLMLLTLISCGGSSEDPPPPSIPSLTINGMASNGVVSDAEIRVFDYSQGQKGQMLGATLTDSEGNYELNFEAPNGSDQPILIEMKSGRYVEEFSGQEVRLQSHHVLSALSSYTTGDRSLNIQITPFTTLATCLAQYRWETQANQSDIEIIQQSYRDIENFINMDSLNNEVISSRQAIDGGSRFTGDIYHGYLLASFSTIVHNLSQSSENDDTQPIDSFNSIELIGKFCEDLRYDGVLNRFGRSKSEVIEIGNIDLPQDIYREGWAQALFRTLDLNLNGAGFNREDILDTVNHMISYETSINSSPPVNEPYSLVRIDSLRSLDDSFKKCIEKEQKIYTDQITELNCSDSISSLEGIESFRYLNTVNFSDIFLDQPFELSGFEYLEYIKLSRTGRISFDLEGLPSLISLDIIDNFFAEPVPINQSPNLQHLTIQTFEGFNIESLIDLKSLKIRDSILNQINLEANSLLESLDIESSTLERIVGLNNPNHLEHLSLDTNYILDVNDFTRLKSLTLKNNALSDPIDTFQSTTPKIDLSLFKELETLYFDKIELTVMDVRNLENIKDIKIIELDINNLNLQNLRNLEKFEMNNSLLVSELDFSNSPKLSDIIIINNRENSQLSELNISTNKQLKNITLLNNPLTELTLDDYSLLENLRLSSIQNLEIRNLESLQYLDLAGITQGEITNLPILKELKIGSSDIQLLDITNSIELESIGLYSTEMNESLNLSNLNRLKSFTIQFSDKIQSISLLQSDQLETIEILSNTNLNNLNLAGLPELTSGHL